MKSQRESQVSRWTALLKELDLKKPYKLSIISKTTGTKNSMRIAMSKCQKSSLKIEMNIHAMQVNQAAAHTIV